MDTQPTALARRRLLAGALAGLALSALAIAPVRAMAEAAATPAATPPAAAVTDATLTDAIIDERSVDWDKAPVRLLMVERRGCVYCATWHAEIGPGYPKSGEGRAAPLLRVDIDGPWPDGLVLDRRPLLTPTFVLLERGVERGRVEGYPGDMYFYPVIQEMLDEAGLAGTAEGS